MYVIIFDPGFEAHFTHRIYLLPQAGRLKTTWAVITGRKYIYIQFQFCFLEKKLLICVSWWGGGRAAVCVYSLLLFQNTLSTFVSFLFLFPLSLLFLPKARRPGPPFPFSLFSLSLSLSLSLHESCQPSPLLFSSSTPPHDYTTRLIISSLPLPPPACLCACFPP